MARSVSTAMAERDSYDNWQAVQEQAERAPSSQQHSIVLNDRSNALGTVDSLCAQLGTLLAQLKLPTIADVFTLLDTNGDGGVSKNEFYEMCTRLKVSACAWALACAQLARLRGCLLVRSLQ